jgi:hypothetical protein
MSFSPYYFQNSVWILDTTNASNSTASLVLNGGLLINATTESTNISSGCVVLSGGIGIGGVLNSNFAVITNVNSTNNTTNNFISTNSSISNLIGDNINFTNITATNFSLSNSLSVLSLIVNGTGGSTLGNTNISNVTVATLNVTTGTTTSNLYAPISTLDNITSSSLYVIDLVNSNATISNLFSTNGNFVVQTVGTLLVSGNSTFNNSLFTNITSNTLSISNTSQLNVLNVSGITTISNTTANSGLGSGALVVNGGTSIAGSLYVESSATINGNLTINGTTTSVNSTVVNIADNFTILNAGPSGSRDAGLMIQRYQNDNNIGSGDIVSGSEPILYSGIVQTGTSTISIIFPSGANAMNEYYTGYWIKITSGSANNNVRQIVAYNGATLTATLDNVLITTPTANVDTFNLYGRDFVGLYYDTGLSGLVFGYSATDPSTLITSTGYSDIFVRTGNFSNGINITGGSTFTDLTITGNLLSNGNTTLGNTFISNLNSTNITVNNIVVNGISSVSNLNVTNSTMTSAIINNQTVSNSLIINSNITNSTINSLNVTNENATNITSGIINVTTGVTTSSLYVSGLSSLSNVTANNVTITSLTSNSSRLIDVTSGTITLTNGLTSASLFISGISNLNGLNAINISTTNLSSNNSTIVNLLSTNQTTSNLVVNTVTMNPSLGDIFTEKSFSAGNGTTGNITGFAFNNAIVQSFQAWVSVKLITNTTSQYALFDIKGIQKTNIWAINSSFIGDNIGIDFNVSTSGQVQYTTSSIGSWVSDTIKFRSITLST